MATAAARRYARAVFELASGEGRVDDWRTQLVALRNLMTQPRVESVLRNPTIPTEQRMGLIATDEGLDPQVVNLGRLLVESGRVQEIAGVAEEFDTLADEAAGRVRAVVTTAVELPDDERDQVARELSSRLGKEVALRTEVDPRVLGGLKLQYGDRLFDATVATRLQQLRRRLIEA